MKRGNLLWEGSRMMLAEHRKLLNSTNLHRRNNFEEEISSDQINFEEWQRTWGEALSKDLEIRIRLKGTKKKIITGKINGWCFEEGYILLIDTQGIKNKVIISEIVDLMIK